MGFKLLWRPRNHFWGIAKLTLATQSIIDCKSGFLKEYALIFLAGLIKVDHIEILGYPIASWANQFIHL
jgi:hypothetical protein